jgi:hypothetical protein
VLKKAHILYVAFYLRVDADLDPDPAYLFDADPDPDPAFYFDSDPDSDPAYHFDADPDPQHCGVFASSFPTSQDTVLMNNATSRIMPALPNKIFKLQILLAQSPAWYFAPKVQIFCLVSR